MGSQQASQLSHLFTRFMQEVGVSNLSGEETQHLRRFINWCGSNTEVSTILPHQVQAYVDQVSSSTHDPKFCVNALRKFFSYAEESGATSSSPASGLRATKRASKSGAKAAKPVQPAQTLISRQRYDELQQELDELRSTGRERVSQQLHAAIKDGDLRENAAYDEAKYQQGMLEARIRELEQILRTSQITEDEEARAAAATTPGSNNGIRVGMHVVLADNGDTVEYQLVGPTEVDPLAGRISYLSPVGAALLGKRSGDTVKIETPAGSLSYKVVSYKF